MSWNPFKKPKDEAEEAMTPAAPAQDSPEALVVDDDPTDPLGQPAQLSEQVTLIHQADDSRIEHVLITNGQQQQQLLRLTIGSDQALAKALAQLFIELPEEFSGFRDLLLRPEAQYAAALIAPDACLAEFASGESRIVPRVIDVLKCIASLARALEKIELVSGLHWREARLGELGLVTDQLGDLEGYTSYRLAFTGWLSLTPDPGATAQDVAAAFLPVFDQLTRQAASNGYMFCAAETERVAELVRGLAGRDELRFSELAQALETPFLEFELGSVTDAGQRREHNEDAFLTAELKQTSASGARMLLAAVADGMGGHQSGEIASSLALDLLRQQLNLALLAPSISPVNTRQLVPQLEAIIPAIDRAISERALMEPELGGMGTTMVGFCLIDAQSTANPESEFIGERSAAIFSVGDSRAYLIGPAGIQRLSTDHSYVQGLVASGTISRDEAFNHPQKNVITRCIGGGISDGTPDVHSFQPGPGEVLLLCSDGLTDVLRDEDIAKVVGGSAVSSLQGLAEQLVDKANAGGGPDNITVLLVGIRIG